MAGNHLSGRRRKTTTEHIANGTYKPGRHGRRCDVGKTERPTKTRGMAKDAAKLWDQVVDWLTDHGQAQSQDAALLEAMCRTWALCRVALAAAEKSPLDKDARIAATQYLQRFEAISSRFGMTPVDRARLTIESGREAATDKSEFFKVIA